MVTRVNVTTILIGCSKTRTVQLVLSTCIPMRPFTLEFANSSSVQFTCCKQAFTFIRVKVIVREATITKFNTRTACAVSILMFGVRILRLVLMLLLWCGLIRIKLKMADIAGDQFQGAGVQGAQMS